MQIRVGQEEPGANGLCRGAQVVGNLYMSCGKGPWLGGVTGSACPILFHKDMNDELHVISLEIAYACSFLKLQRVSSWPLACAHIV